MMAPHIHRKALRLALGSGACLILLLAPACKPTEQNYRQAYEKAVARRSESALDSTVYGEMRRNMQHEIGSIEADGRQVPVVAASVKIADGEQATDSALRPYCVVAAQFKQVFNARSMRTRLADNGYPDAFVMQTGEPYYYVVAASFDDVQPAIDMLSRLAHDTQLQLKAPMPMVVQPARRR